MAPRTAIPWAHCLPDRQAKAQPAGANQSMVEAGEGSGRLEENFAAFYMLSM